MTDLSLIPIDDILDELRNRYDYFVLCGIKSLDKDMEDLFFEYHGGEVAALGMAGYIEVVVKRNMSEGSRRIE